ncbi:hypothetical protein ACLB2K_051077 [Fragaria x ananassa]
MTPGRSGGGIFEGLYRVIMRRNSVYVTFVIAGAFLGEQAVDYGVHRLWEYNNVGTQSITPHTYILIISSSSTLGFPLFSSASNIIRKLAVYSATVVCQSGECEVCTLFYV